MKVIVKSPNHDVVVADELQLLLIDRIVCEIADVVIAEPERRFMSDHHVLARRGGPLNHIDSRHDCRGDSLNRTVNIT